MKNSFKECLLMAAGALLSAACDEKDLVCDPEPPVTVTVVTEELAAWTIKRDSFPSSTPCRLLAGQVDDATSGKTTVCPYFVLSSPRSDGLWAGCEYDSVTFFARSDQTVWGDPNPLQTFHLYRLNKLLPTAPVFSNATFGHEAEPLGTMVLYPGEGRVFDLRCRLSDAFGRELFGMLLEGSDVLKDADLFRDYFRGVALVPDPLNTLIMGLDPSQGGVGITVHYHDGDASGGGVPLPPGRRKISPTCSSI